jgi:hypothetical protein
MGTSTFWLSQAPKTVNLALKRKEKLFLYSIKFRQRHSSSGFPPWRPGFKPGFGEVGLLVDKVALGSVFSPANLHSTKFSIIIITQGRYNRPISGRRAEWTQLDSTPSLWKFLIKLHAIKMHGEVEGYLQEYITSAWPFYSGERAPGSQHFGCAQSQRGALCWE